MITRLTICLAAVGVAAILSGCDPADSTGCDPACAEGLVCSTGTASCEPPRLQKAQDEPAGRSVRMVVIDERTYLASIEPDTGKILVGHAGEETPLMYSLSSITRPLGRKLALASSSTTVALAWLEQDRRYRVAIHQVGDDIDRWRILPAVDTQQDYRGSEHFDLAVDASGRIQLVFHDAATRALRSLSGSADSEIWDDSVVDDPGEQTETGVCSEQQRRLSGRGLGYYPDIVLRGGAAFIAYHDADCGDLRLASRIDDQWAVTVVDTGDFEHDDDLSSLRRGVTGKYASVAVDSAGNLAIAYQDTSRGQLLIAYDRQGQFSIETADAGYEVDEFSRRQKHLVGGYASLVFDTNDIPWIAYIDSTTARLRLAHRTQPFSLDGNWAQQRIPASMPTGFSTNLGFSASFGPVIAAERLRPSPDGLESHLDVLFEEAF